MMVLELINYADYIEENQLLADLKGLELEIERAEAEGEIAKLASLVPIHYQLCIGEERVQHIKQAIDDWRIAYLDLWQFSDHLSAWSYFEGEAKGDWCKSAKTRLAYANAIQFFKVEQGWTFEELVEAGIGKLNVLRTYCERHADEFGRLDPLLKGLMLDRDISISQVPRAFKNLKKADREAEEEEPVETKDELPPAWKPKVYGYRDASTTRLVAWLPYPDEVGARQEVEVELGYLMTDSPEKQEIVQGIVDGEIKITLSYD